MQNWKKGCVFGRITNFGKDMTEKLKKNACKNAYLRSIFIPEKYVFRVCFESPFTRMISNLKYKWPPSRDETLKSHCMRWCSQLKIEWLCLEWKVTKLNKIRNCSSENMICMNIMSSWSRALQVFEESSNIHSLRPHYTKSLHKWCRGR